MSDSPIVRSEQQPWMERAHGELFAVKCRRLSHAGGSKAIGCNMFELAPGKTAMPFHYHLANEEAMYVLAGNGTLRLGDQRHAVKAGDYVAFAVGKDPHQLTNTGSDALRYLVMSTRLAADAMVYPDSNKVGVMAGEGKDTFARFFTDDSKVDYWHGEPAGTKPEAESKDDDDDDDDDDLEQRIDDEINELKKKLGLSGAKPGGKRPKPPKRGSTARKVVDDALDEIERLKRILDGD